MNPYLFEENSAYRLIDVRDHLGNSKVESRDLYMERVGSITKHIKCSTTHFNGETYHIIQMDFVQDKEGHCIYKHLRTSPVQEINEVLDHIEIKTLNSVYVLEPAQLPLMKYQDTSELIELYLSDEDSRFVRGVYYDGDRQPHDLGSFVHVGMVVDSCLVHISCDFVCGYIISFTFLRLVAHEASTFRTPTLVSHNADAFATLR